MNQPDQIVRDLQDRIEKDPDLGDLIEKSLRRAHERAQDSLRRDLFEELDWPQTLEEYYDYLKGFVRWIPRQSDNPVWQSQNPGQRFAREVSDRLSHFYFLTDQEVDADGTVIAQRSDELRDWLTRFARQWGDFLDTPESFDEEILESFLKDAPEYHVEESLIDGRPNMPSGWRTFNQFFARELNGGLRPISDPVDNAVVTSPADCMYISTFGIDGESNIPETAIKETHRYGNIQDLLEGSRYAEAFAGGTFVHYELPPSAYHRFHLPVAGWVEESYVVQGRVYMEVDLQEDKLQSKDNAKTGYEFTQTRGVVTLDTAASGNGDLGVVAVLPVGMAHVASVNLTATQGTQMAKGDEFGYFLFGGSDIIVLFQEGVDPQIDQTEGFRLVGTPIARAKLRG